LTNLSCFLASRRNSRPILTSSSSLGGPKEGRDGRLGGANELQLVRKAVTKSTHAEVLRHRRNAPALILIEGL
jgi:hypothetical protein